MSQALPGMHYCKEHQGNHSHYDSHNCELCEALILLWESRDLAISEGWTKFENKINAFLAKHDDAR